MYSIPSAQVPDPRCPVSATPTHMLRICVNPRLALSAGVQTMRARICSAFSCDMFARVVWLKPRGAAIPPTFALPFAARTCHAWLARLTRARGGCFLRGRKALLNDFWYFWSYKSTIKRKYLYISSQANNIRPYKLKPKHSQQTKQKICTLSAFSFAYTGAKEKAIKKKTPISEFRTLRSATRALPFEPASL